MTRKHERELERLADIQASYSMILGGDQPTPPKKEELRRRLQAIEDRVEMLKTIRKERFLDG